MKLDPRRILTPVLAFAVMLVVVQQTLVALETSAAWPSRPRVPLIRPEDPYARLDGMLAQHPSDPPGTVRDPFEFVAAPIPQQVRPRHHEVVVVAPPPPEIPQPTLTSIIWDEDPRATVRFNGRDFSVRQNSLFADFTVKSIRPTEVVLDHGGQEVVLRLPSKGEQH